MSIPDNGVTEVAVTVKVTTTFEAATDGVILTLHVDTIGADEALNTDALTDAVTLGG